MAFLVLKYRGIALSSVMWCSSSGLEPSLPAFAKHSLPSGPAFPRKLLPLQTYICRLQMFPKDPVNYLYVLCCFTCCRCVAWKAWCTIYNTMRVNSLYVCAWASRVIFPNLLNASVRDVWKGSERVMFLCTVSCFVCVCVWCFITRSSNRKRKGNVGIVISVNFDVF